VNISQNGIALIKKFEGCSLEAYPDPATGGRPWTIGYGHTHAVEPHTYITQEQADAFLREDLTLAELAIHANVRVPITQNQFDALCSFTFNLGVAALVGSTLLKKINAGDYTGAADEFVKWNHANGKVLPGLTARRAAERDLFLS
jgi:lysozyme